MNDRQPGSDQALLSDFASQRSGSASAARIYDYWLGGKDHFPVDRLVGDAVAELLPWLVAVRANRRFLVRVVRCLAGRGVDQFVDVGCGLPTALNVHEVAQGVRAGARTVYVDRDPVVLTHARALLACDGRTVVVGGDARDPAGLLAALRADAGVDWSRPVAVLMVAVLHFLTDADDPAATVAAFRQVMVPGSFLVVSHAAPGPVAQAEAMREAVARYQELAAPFTPRTAARLTGLLAGFDLLDPGVVPVGRWRPPGGRVPARSDVAAGQGLAVLARVPDTAPTGRACGPASGEGSV